MNTNDYTPKFKKPKKTGYHLDVPKKLAQKKNADSTAYLVATKSGNSVKSSAFNHFEK